MPNNFGIVEECQKIRLSQVLKEYRRQLKEIMLQQVLEVNGIQASLTSTQTPNGGTRYWFVCPSCERRVGVLLIHPLIENVGCQKCLPVSYKKQRYNKMLENEL